MSKNKKRHHRKIQQFHRSVPRDVAKVIPTIDPAYEQVSSSLTLVKRDLQRTGLIVIALLAILILSYYLDREYNWTLGAGATLYRLLHIR